jgi:CheY-like chemotaxis protein
MTPNRSILLVDDDQGIREALTDMLRDEGFSVQSAQNGKDAIEWLRHNTPVPRVILLDLMMPVMDGQEFLHVRQSDSVLSKVPVVVITAGNRFGDIQRSHDVRECISKPIALPRLLAAIEACA